MELIYGQINVLSIEFDANEKHLTSAHLPREVNDREGLIESGSKSWRMLLLRNMGSRGVGTKLPIGMLVTDIESIHSLPTPGNNTDFHLSYL